MSPPTFIDVTWTRKGTWFVTFPCGFGHEFQGELPEELIRAYCARHKRTCCKSARLVVETTYGYREVRSA